METMEMNTNNIEETAEVQEDFSYNGYQVVRREFFSHIFDPSITFNRERVYVNSATLKKLPDVEYVQILINPESHKLVVRPCEEYEKDSFAWSRVTKQGKVVSKQVTCRIFFAKLFELMNWNPDYRYKLLGKLVSSNGESLFVFDMDSTEVYQRIIMENGKPKMSRIPVFPSDWKNQFGLTVEEHKKQLQVNLFEDYVVFGVRNKEKDTSHIDEALVEGTGESEDADASNENTSFIQGDIERRRFF